jgi:signal transduction histidine kinase
MFIKHARAKRVRITLECNPAWMQIEVSGDGVGFDARGDFPGHLGLRSMRERAARSGGVFEAESVPGVGTRVRAGIPV